MTQSCVRLPGFFSLPVLSLSVAATATLLAPPTEAQVLFRSIDGTFNNFFQVQWGGAGEALMRQSAVEYSDGVSSPAGASRPSAREISNAVVAQSLSVPNTALASDYIWQWGQFLDHDIDLTGPSAPAESFDITVPLGDPWFDPFSTGNELIPLTRSLYTIDGSSVRQQSNEITAWIDGSGVYGSDSARALELRVLDGTGRLKTTPGTFGEMLPFNLNGFPNAPSDGDPSMFLAGDVRANEQVCLTAMHTLFVREHNFMATVVGVIFPLLNGNLRYEIARALVGAEIQRITYEEFLPLLLGPGALSPYSGYQPFAEPSIANLFSTASYRFGHSQLNSQFLRLGPDGSPITLGNLALQNAFFTPATFQTHGIEPLLRGLATQVAQEVDTLVVDDLRNFLFGMPGSGGFDLASLNIQRGRDHGLPDYNQARVDYGLAPVTSWSEITSDPVLAQALSDAYGSIGEVDAWVGGLAEDHFPGAMVGPLVRAVLIDQFERLRDGDRFWYEISLVPVFFDGYLKTQTLSTIIRRNTQIGPELQSDVFIVPGP